jgi:cell division GTPase FtsZ
MNEENVQSLVSGQGLKIAVIGVGNAGGQVALLAAQKGFPVFVLNTSVKDLDDAVLGDQIKGYQIGDGRGSGKDRDNAMALLKSKGKSGIADIFTNPFFRQIVEPADVVFVTFSTGGGTGSGIGPEMAKMIHRAYATKVIIPYGILPKNVESVMAQANAIACVDDMTQCGTPYMLADLSFYEEESQEKSFKLIGDYMVETMCVIRGDYLKMSANGMADERDVLTVISEPGYMTIHIKDAITEPMLAEKTLQGFIIDQVKASPACRIQRDGLLQYSLLISNVNSSVSDPMKVGNYQELNDFVGEPKATYANYAVDDTISEFQVIAVSSGLTVPLDRFTAAKAKIKANKDKFEKQSALNLGSDRQATAISGNANTRNIVMNSSGVAEADLSFLDD